MVPFVPVQPFDDGSVFRSAGSAEGTRGADSLRAVPPMRGTALMMRFDGGSIYRPKNSPKNGKYWRGFGLGFLGSGTWTTSPGCSGWLSDGVRPLVTTPCRSRVFDSYVPSPFAGREM